MSDPRPGDIVLTRDDNGKLVRGRVTARALGIVVVYLGNPGVTLHRSAGQCVVVVRDKPIHGK